MLDLVNITRKVVFIVAILLIATTLMGASYFYWLTGQMFSHECKVELCDFKDFNKIPLIIYWSVILAATFFSLRFISKKPAKK